MRAMPRPHGCPLRVWRLWPTLLALALTAASPGPGPKVSNPSFEADRYTVAPGYTAAKERLLTGWATEGPGVGINPVWEHPGGGKGAARPFLDNGRTPHGRQVALLQNEATLRQRIPGFRKGHRYQVVYRENGRIQRQPRDHWGWLQVTLGGAVVVSPHEVPPAGRSRDFAVPFHRVESAVFTAPTDGAFELVFRTLKDGGVTVLLDDVHIIEVTD